MRQQYATFTLGANALVDYARTLTSADAATAWLKTLDIRSLRALLNGLGYGTGQGLNRARLISTIIYVTVGGPGR